MIVKASNEMAHKIASAGIQFERLCQGLYLLNGSTTLAELRAAGLMIEVAKKD